MRKKIIIIIVVLFSVLTTIMYFTKNYKIEYEVNSYKVKTIYKSNRYYFEIKGKRTYNFDVYKNRSLKKYKIINIKQIKGDNFYCINPILEDKKDIVLCYKDGIYIDYNLIDSPLLDEYKSEISTSEKDFQYFYNLSDSEYVALWNYKGYYVMNGNDYHDVKLLESDRYDNSLSININDYILMPNYDQEYEFTSFLILNIKTMTFKIIESKYAIDYDSYIAGVNKSKVYLFDNKHLSLYEINIKNKKVNLIGNEELGYKKIIDNKLASATKKEYLNKITYFQKENSNYEFVIDGNNTYMIYKDNKNIRKLIFDDKVNIIKIYNNYIYYICDDEFYLYDTLKKDKIFHYYELNFNQNNISIFNN